MARPTQQEIDEFNARMSEPDTDEDDFEIEIFTPEGHGARLPYRKGRAYLSQHFGIDVGDLPNAGGNPQQQGNTQGQQGKRGGNSANGNPGNAPGNEGEMENPDLNAGQGRPSQRYFGRR